MAGEVELAMANQTVLEELVVRLTADNSNLIKVAAESATAIRTMTNRMYTAMSRAERFAGTLLRGLGSFGLASGLRGMFQQFADLEQGQIRLNAAIRGGGHDVEALTARYTAVAESLSAITLNTKGSILGLFQQAEAAQLSGDKAEQAVRYSIALAGATRQTADAMMRTAIQLAKGHPEFAKRILNLREVANGSELVDAIMRKMNTGMEIATAEFNSANGRMERLGRGFKSLGQDVGGMIAKVLIPITGMLQQVVDAFKRLDPEVKQQIALWTGLAVAWLGMAPVTQVIKDLLAPTIHLIKFIAIEIPLMVLRSFVWLAWKSILLVTGVAITAVGIASLLLTGKLAALKAVVLLLGAAMGLQSVMASIAATANAVWAASSVVGIVAIVAALGALVVVGMAVYSAVTAVVRVFRAIPSMSGPLGVVTKALAEWWTMLKEIFGVAQSDMPKAWEMLKAGFSLAIRQVEDLFPPMWEFLASGFEETWIAVSKTFKNVMMDSIRDILEVFRGMWFVNPGGAAAAAGILRALPANEEDPIGRFRANMQLLTDNFHVLESAETRAARALYESLRPAGNALNRAVDPLARFEALMKKTADHAQRFDAALSGSVEAVARMVEYQDRLRFAESSRSINPAVVAAASMVGLGGGAAGTAPVVDVLREILGQLQRSPVVQVRPAALGGN